jgi:hypothetical protein
MNVTTAAVATPPAPGNLAACLDASERLLQDCASRTRRANRLTVIVGVGLLLLLGGYFAYGYQQISSVMEPDTLVSVAEQWLEDKLPEGRQAAQAEIDKSAPVWAENLSKQAQTSLPSIREKLEGYVVEQVDQTIDQTVDVTETRFRDFLRDNRDLLEKGFKDLATSPKLADESLEQLVEALNSKLEVDMKLGSKELFTTLEQMNVKLQRLRDDRKLTPEEAMERRALTLLRRLQLENVNSSSLGSSTVENASAGRE